MHLKTLRKVEIDANSSKMKNKVLNFGINRFILAIFNKRFGSLFMNQNGYFPLPLNCFVSHIEFVFSKIGK